VRSTISANEHKPLSEDCRRAGSLLAAGGVVAIPTDTVYGLAAVAADAAAVGRVYEIKRRPADQPLSLFVASIEQAQLLAEPGEPALALARRFWPGALTIVAPLRPSFATRAAAGTGTIGLRVRADAALRELAAQLGPLTATSANRSGEPAARTAEEVRAQFGDDIDLILDAQPSPREDPSTVVDCTSGQDVRVLREGGVSREAIAGALAGLASVR